METSQAAEIDAWVRQGGIVVAASERAARAALDAFAERRRAEGLSAWPAPPITHWASFVRSEWEQRAADIRMPLSSAQEQKMWQSAMEAGRLPRVLTPMSARRLAAMAMSAHATLANYAPNYLDIAARRDWQFDAAEFSRWLARFDRMSTEQQVVSGHRLPGEVAAALRSDRSARPALLLVGFDRISPAQQTVFGAWGDVRQLEAVNKATERMYYAAADHRAELAACAEWAKKHLADSPATRLIVIADNVAQSRGGMERAFLDADLGHSIEFSLGISLAGVGLARSALLTLQFLTSSLAEAQLDWLIASGYLAPSPAVSAALERSMRRVRRAGLERAEWHLNDFCRNAAREAGAQAWCSNLLQTQKLLRENGGERTPLEWAALTSRLLQTAGWPGGSNLSSDEYQAQEAFDRVVEVTGSLGFDGSQQTWRDFLAELFTLAAETLFSPESRQKPILVAGPAESAGLEADAIWFLGADQENWPARGDMHPLLPAWLQRECGMPHGSGQLDWQLARTMTMRLLASAPQIYFSYARQVDGIEKRPSLLICEAACSPAEMPREFQNAPQPAPIAERIYDAESVPLCSPAESFHSDSATISSQSQCPFKAFAIARLGARGWTSAGVGLSPALRGQILHDVLARVWSGPPAGICNSEELRAIRHLPSFVTPHVEAAILRIPPELRSNLPERYVALEQQRVVGLVCEWLTYEQTRADFAVQAVEHETRPSVAGLSLKLRLDRVDRLNDGSVLVIDYKTGNVNPKSWDLPRPDDLQLPLYGQFGLAETERVGGISFAMLHAADVCFTGRIQDPENTIGNVQNLAGLRKTRLTAEMLAQWRDAIEAMARDFVDGRILVDPREPRATCARCKLQTVCRISEVDDPDTEEADA